MYSIDQIIMQFHRIEPPYTSPDECRLIWRRIDEDDEHVVILNKEELNQLIEILKNNTTGKIELQDQVSRMLLSLILRMEFKRLYCEDWY